MKKIQLLVIDPQNSFCKVVPQADQQRLHDGELCVDGAWDDMNRVANMVTRLGDKLDDITITLDSHHQLHIAHPYWFKDNSGKHPDPFTIMRAEKGIIIGAKYGADGNPHDVGEFQTAKMGLHKWTLSYLEQLAATGRYPHCIWPVHCLIGTAGHNIVDPLLDAILEWERANVAFVSKITKGSNPFVEHFSALQAEVPHPSDPTTQVNSEFLSLFVDADEILLAGEASSHCLANTVRDMANQFGTADTFIRKAILLTDATSPVPGFKAYEDSFVKDMTARGMRLATTTEYLA